MNILFFDQDLQTIGSVGVYTTLIWNRRYYQPGSFELHLAAEYFALINEAMYLWRNDRKELGVINEVNYSCDENGKRTVYCKGYFAEHLLNDRVTQPTYAALGPRAWLAYNLISRYIVDPEDPSRKIKHIRVPEQWPVEGESFHWRDTGTPIGDLLYDFLRVDEMSQRLTFDHIANDLTYEIWQGVDRRDTQDVNSWAIFSDSFCNIKSTKYTRETSDHKNIAYVAGAGEGDARIVVEVDVRQDPNEERRELYVDARDLQKETEDNTYTDEQYEKMLRQRGLEKLTEYAAVETVDSDVDPTANLVYGVDFDLGDLCTYRHRGLGLECSKRITEIQEIFEGPKRTLKIIFGNDSPTTLKKIIKKEMG